MVGLLLLGPFIVVERRSRNPLLPPRLLANPMLVLAVVVAFMFTATFGSLLYFLSTYFQDVWGYGALATGLGFAGGIAITFLITTVLWTGRHPKPTPA